MTNTVSKFNVMSWFGAPVSGKGLRGRLVKELWGIPVNVMRDIIRAEKAGNGRFRELAEDCERRRALIPNNEILPVFRKRLSLPQSGGWIGLDGIPRDRNQVLEVNDYLRSLGAKEFNLIELKIDDDEVLEQRFLETLSAADRSGRLDANLTIHREGVRIFRENRRPVLEAARRLRWKIVTLDARQEAAAHIKDLQKALALPHIRRDQKVRVLKALNLPLPIAA